MAKYTLENNFDFGFILFEIVCHESEYRICSTINRALGIDLGRDKSLELKNKKQQDLLIFSVFTYTDESTGNIYHLLNNLSSNAVRSVSAAKNTAQASLFDDTPDEHSQQKGRLIPEKEDVDFFLLLNGDFSDADIASVKANLEKDNVIINIKEIDPESLASKNNLLF